MAITVGGSTITFNDGTTQSTAAGAGVLSKSYYSGDITMPSSQYQQYSVAHGMGVMPKIVFMRAYCTSAVWGFSAGQEISMFCNAANNGNQQTQGYWCDSSNIYYITGSALIVIRQDNQYAQQLLGNSAYFTLRIYAYA